MGEKGVEQKLSNERTLTKHKILSMTMCSQAVYCLAMRASVGFTTSFQCHECLAFTRREL